MRDTSDDPVRLEFTIPPRPSQDADRIIVARLSGIASRHVPKGWREPTPEETAAAAAELQSVAQGRADLLAEEAGIELGTGEGGLYERFQRIAASFCIAAGADPDLIGQWISVGRQRAARDRARMAAETRRRTTHDGRLRAGSEERCGLGLDAPTAASGRTRVGGAASPGSRGQAGGRWAAVRVPARAASARPSRVLSG